MLNPQEYIWSSDESHLSTHKHTVRQPNYHTYSVYKHTTIQTAGPSLSDHIFFCFSSSLASFKSISASHSRPSQPPTRSHCPYWNLLCLTSTLLPNFYLLFFITARVALLPTAPLFPLLPYLLSHNPFPQKTLVLRIGNYFLCPGTGRLGPVKKLGSDSKQKGVREGGGGGGEDPPK